MFISRIESRESFPVPKRLHYIIHLGKGTADFFIEGREMKDEEIGDILIQLTNAVNAAEKQIEMLLKTIGEAEIDKEYFEDYLDEYPEEENYKAKYKLEDVKDALFHAMMKKDEKLISKYLNQLSVITEKQKANG
jgi:hypothetical protein